MVYQSDLLNTRVIHGYMRQLFLLEKYQAAKEFLISKSKRELGFRQRNSTRISADSYIEKGRNSNTDDSVREIDDDLATWNQLTNSYEVLQTGPDLRTTW